MLKYEAEFNVNINNMLWESMRTFPIILHLHCIRKKEALTAEVVPDMRWRKRTRT